MQTKVVEAPVVEAPHNKLLAALPAEDYARLLPTLAPVPFTFQKFFHKQGLRIDSVVFPSSGVASVVNVMADGRMVEVATVGNEGALGSTVFLGGDVSLADSFVQVPGEAPALSMPAAAFRRELERRGAFYDLLSRYSQALQALIMQSTACNVLHSVEERCARWLLMTHDRVPGNEIRLTHEFLGMMLGARRPTVSLVLGTLAKAGLIHNATKKIVVLDRTRLEEASCECYEMVQSVFERLLPTRRHELIQQKT
jgi:CRP-like cAMP-binding protein